MFICLSGTILEKMLRMLWSISVGQFLMTAQFVWILIGDSRKAGNGAVVEVVDRWTYCASYILLNFLPFLFSKFCFSLFLQVRDEYRTDYDPDILSLYYDVCYFISPWSGWQLVVLIFHKNRWFWSLFLFLQFNGVIIAFKLETRTLLDY